MSKKLLIALIASLGIGAAQASPLTFTSGAYDTAAFAVVGSLADFNTAASPPTALPLLSEATVIGLNDFATSGAFASSGLLFTSAEADSFTGPPGTRGANSGAQSHFNGSILSTGLLTFHMDLTDIDSIVGNGSSDATLFVLLTNTVGAATTTIVDTFFTRGGPIDLQYYARSGVTKLDLLLFSEASTTAAGQSAQNFAQVGFGAALPLPATLPLLLAAMGAMLFMRRKNGKSAN